MDTMKRRYATNTRRNFTRVGTTYFLIAGVACQNAENGESDASDSLSQSESSSGDDASSTSGASSSTDHTATESGNSSSQQSSDSSEQCPDEPVDGDPKPEFLKIADGFSIPVMVTSHPSREDTLFVVEKTGSIKILKPGETVAPAASFLTVDEDSSSNEMGLLGLALHPNFATEGRFYVNYNPRGGKRRTRIAEFKVDPADPERADPASERVLLEIEQPESNHNGGGIAFGPDGYLYIGMGDGGGQGDAHGEIGNGQDPLALLGKFLRIGVDPDGARAYSIPSDNPFVGDADFAPEIWALGLRNPWRFAFDDATGWLYCGDVGQNAREEIDIIEKGRNYGWREMEGTQCYNGAQCGDSVAANQVNSKGYSMPIAEYSHNGGQASVTGGEVYRHCEVPAWHGRYFYVDYVTTRLYALSWDGTSATLHGDNGVVGNFIENWALTSFGRDTDGHIVAVATHKLGIESGRVYRLAPAASN
jgi:glucose/arabinose dehydrogenase